MSLMSMCDTNIDQLYMQESNLSDMKKLDDVFVLTITLIFVFDLNKVRNIFYSTPNEKNEGNALLTPFDRQTKVANLINELIRPMETS